MRNFHNAFFNLIEFVIPNVRSLHPDALYIGNPVGDLLLLLSHNVAFLLFIPLIINPQRCHYRESRSLFLIPMCVLCIPMLYIWILYLGWNPDENIRLLLFPPLFLCRGVSSRVGESPLLFLCRGVSSALFVSGSLLLCRGVSSALFVSVSLLCSFFVSVSLLLCRGISSCVGESHLLFLCRGVSSALFVSGSLICSFCVGESPLVSGSLLCSFCVGESPLVSGSLICSFCVGESLCSLEGLPTQNFPSNKFLHSLITIH